tara:strand:- start:318 stop:728 length:411 start_codon:yes stop_codon:yes gene_type:complete
MESAMQYAERIRGLDAPLANASLAAAEDAGMWEGIPPRVLSSHLAWMLAAAANEASNGNFKFPVADMKARNVVVKIFILPNKEKAEAVAEGPLSSLFLGGFKWAHGASIAREALETSGLLADRSVADNAFVAFARS